MNQKEGMHTAIPEASMSPPPIPGNIPSNPSIFAPKSPSNPSVFPPQEEEGNLGNFLSTAVAANKDESLS